MSLTKNGKPKPPNEKYLAKTTKCLSKTAKNAGLSSWVKCACLSQWATTFGCISTTQSPLVLKSLNALEERLASMHTRFFGPTASTNLQFIEKIEPWFSGGLLVTLRRNGEKIEISRRQAIRFKEILSV